MPRCTCRPFGRKVHGDYPCPRHGGHVNVDNLVKYFDYVEHLEALSEIDARDPRWLGLLAGLRQLNSEQIQRLLDWEGPIRLDDCNYRDGQFCPLSIAVGLPVIMREPSDAKVVQVLLLLGYDVYNTRGLEGKFYTTNRREDLMTAAREVLAERHAATVQCEAL